MVAGLALAPHATAMDLTTDAHSALSGDGDMISIGGDSQADSLPQGQGLGQGLGQGRRGTRIGGGVGVGVEGSVTAKSEISTQPSVAAHGQGLGQGQGRGGGMLGGGLERSPTKRRNRLRRKVPLGSNLISLNIARNNLGPPVATGTIYTLLNIPSYTSPPSTISPQSTIPSLTNTPPHNNPPSQTCTPTTPPLSQTCTPTITPPLTNMYPYPPCMHSSHRPVLRARDIQLLHHLVKHLQQPPRNRHPFAHRGARTIRARIARRSRRRRVAQPPHLTGELPHPVPPRPEQHPDPPRAAAHRLRRA